MNRHARTVIPTLVIIQKMFISRVQNSDRSTGGWGWGVGGRNYYVFLIISGLCFNYFCHTTV